MNNVTSGSILGATGTWVQSTTQSLYDHAKTAIGKGCALGLPSALMSVGLFASAVVAFKVGYQAHREGKVIRATAYNLIGAAATMASIANLFRVVSNLRNDTYVSDGTLKVRYVEGQFALKHNGETSLHQNVIKAVGPWKDQQWIEGSELAKLGDAYKNCIALLRLTDHKGNVKEICSEATCDEFVDSVICEVGENTIANLMINGENWLPALDSDKLLSSFFVRKVYDVPHGSQNLEFFRKSSTEDDCQLYRIVDSCKADKVKDFTACQAVMNTKEAGNVVVELVSQPYFNVFNEEKTVCPGTLAHRWAGETAASMAWPFCQDPECRTEYQKVRKYKPE